MVPENYNKLITGLTIRTSRGEVNWKRTTNAGLFFISFTGFSLSINRFYDSEGDYTIMFKIYDGKGNELDRFNIYGGDEQWDRISEMYDAARREALNLDKAIETMSKEVESARVVGLQEERVEKRKAEKDEDIPF